MGDPQVILYRGLSGCGKSSLASGLQLLLEGDKKVEILSTDDFWGEDYLKNFDPRRLGEAHTWNFERFHTMIPGLQYSPNMILAVTNTNILAWELSPYISLCNLYKARYEIITIICPFEVAVSKNVHGVPLSTLWSMYRALLTEELPRFWNHRVVSYVPWNKEKP